MEGRGGRGGAEDDDEEEPDREGEEWRGHIGAAARGEGCGLEERETGDGRAAGVGDEGSEGRRGE